MRWRLSSCLSHCFSARNQMVECLISNQVPRREGPVFMEMAGRPHTSVPAAKCVGGQLQLSNPRITASLLFSWHSTAQGQPWVKPWCISSAVIWDWLSRPSQAFHKDLISYMKALLPTHLEHSICSAEALLKQPQTYENNMWFQYSMPVAFTNSN